MKASAFLVVLLTAAACFPWASAQKDAVDGFGPTFPIDVDSFAWTMAMTAKSLAPEGQKIYMFSPYVPLEYKGKISEGMIHIHMFKVAINDSQEKCIFVTALSPLTSKSSFELIVKDRKFYPCNLDLYETLTYYR